MPSTINPFPSVSKLSNEFGMEWPRYAIAAAQSDRAEQLLKEAILGEAESDRILDADTSLVLCGSFARYEMVTGSDCDWTLLINGVVSNRHAQTARLIGRAIDTADKTGKGLKAPGTSGTFGNLSFSHDLVHRIGGGADSNANLTRRVLMLLESRAVSFSPADSSREVWKAVVRSILERYFEEDAHFSAHGERKVPRFLLNDLTRYWRTIGVDYAAKYLEQGGKKWAIRNAKLRMSRKLLYAAGVAFCFACQLSPPNSPTEGSSHFLANLFPAYSEGSGSFVNEAINFADTPPLEFLATFVNRFVEDTAKRKRVSQKLFGAYDAWLGILNDDGARTTLETLNHEQARKDPVFNNVREIASEFSSGLKLLFFNREEDLEDPIADLSLEYVGF